MQYPDFMIDIETVGLRPDRHGMIQIACVPFDLSKREIGTVYFDRCLEIPPTRVKDEKTMTWWFSKNTHVYNGIIARMENPHHVMLWLKEFVEKTGISRPKFWCKRPFDWQFIESYFHDFGVPNPFHYQNVIEMTSFMKGFFFPEWRTPPALPFEGDKHNAYDDVTHQIKTLFAAVYDTAISTKQPLLIDVSENSSCTEIFKPEL